jgi:hypothetical protein
MTHFIVILMYITFLIWIWHLCGKTMCPQLFPSNGCCTVACLQSWYMWQYFSDELRASEIESFVFGCTWVQVSSAQTSCFTSEVTGFGLDDRVRFLRRAWNAPFSTTGPHPRGDCRLVPRRKDVWAPPPAGEAYNAWRFTSTPPIRVHGVLNKHSSWGTPLRMRLLWWLLSLVCHALCMRHLSRSCPHLMQYSGVRARCNKTIEFYNCSHFEDFVCF